jgi:hypothetical protein
LTAKTVSILFGTGKDRLSFSLRLLLGALSNGFRLLFCLGVQPLRLLPCLHHDGAAQAIQYLVLQFS